MGEGNIRRVTFYVHAVQLLQVDSHEVQTITNMVTPVANTSCLWFRLKS